ncbi:hypothetical protein L195_g047438 [Trifolium pratense]|uniref:Uncharacterized protein n=1 Tax=Trifolium pratense TaxID=57577 RepID=A0A2K3MKI8_TRIPR|nr:hypothetical protein L195_g047438 [Trifolium pratense]
MFRIRALYTPEPSTAGNQAFWKALWKVQVIQRLWFVSPLGLHVPPLMSLSDWVHKWLTNSNLQAAQLFSLTLWRIWKGRNDVVFNNSQFCPVKIASEISGFAAEFNEACNVFTGEGSSGLSTTAVDGWVSPAEL